MNKSSKLIEMHSDERHFGIYRGIMSDNKDPLKLGRLKLRVPSVLAEEVTGWALPCLPYGGGPQQGLFMVPDNESHVWVEFEEGDILNLGKINKYGFDHAFCVAVLQHIPGENLQINALRQLKNKINNNGKTIISVWNMWSSARTKPSGGKKRTTITNRGSQQDAWTSLFNLLFSIDDLILF